MITHDVLATYKRFNGDLDGWERLGATGDASMGPALYRLAEVIQRAGLVTRGLADQAFEALVRGEVAQASASPEVAAQIWALAVRDTMPD